jgi:hypothetical protein
MAKWSSRPHGTVGLADETTGTLYVLGEDWRIVAVLGFGSRP